jgi:hypothetical protein
MLSVGRVARTVGSLVGCSNQNGNANSAKLVGTFSVLDSAYHSLYVLFVFLMMRKT